MELSYDKFQQDVREILGSGVKNTGKFMELMRERGWPDKIILPASYQLLLWGKLDPQGPTTPYKTN